MTGKASGCEVELSRNRFTNQEAFVSHANAALTPRARLRLAQLVVDRGWTYAAAAKMFMVAPRTAKKWADRFRTEGAAGMADRSSRPHSSPARTRPEVVRQIVKLRWRRRLGPIQIAARLDMAGSTVHAVLTRCRINRLSHIDRVTGEPLRRYEHAHPGSLIHVDVTKFGNIPDGGGHKFLGRRQSKLNAIQTARRTGQRGKQYHPRIGTAFVHTVIDDHSRMAYAEICTDEKALTAIGVLQRAVAWFWRTRRHRRASPVRQRVGVHVLRLARRLCRTADHSEADPAIPAPDQRQDRAIPPHPRRRLGLRPALCVNRTARLGPSRLAAFL